jgi:ectoine hydroxylase-related dioxygenase (phytanoyl-CoA dioxygenase family)
VNDAEPSPAEILNERKILSDAQLAEWHENGYLVLPRFMPHGRVRDLNSQLDALWRERKKDDHGLVVDVFTGTHRERRIPFAKATDRARAKPYRINDMYLMSELVRETLLDPELVEVLDDLLEGLPIVCNSLSMERGSQQRLHVDTFYVAPPEPGRMVGAMVVLEDTKPEAGPFRFYPGSHAIPPFVFSDGRVNVRNDELGAWDEYVTQELAERELTPIEFQGNAGDVLIWHPQMINCGSPIQDLTLTNKAIYAHYFRAKDVDPDAREDIGGDRYYLKRDHPSLG